MNGRWRLLGHVLLTTPSNIVYDSVSWTPVGARRVGRPKPTFMITKRREAADEICGR